ncbi:MAG TPA: alpha/beta hydrolase [Terriglobales bacterium]|nr:alpha/beta hydrolase [Terriglobales bacterium]
MSVPVQALVCLIAVALLAALALSIWFYRHPIAATVWSRRRRLQRAGFKKTIIQTSVGLQIVWHGGSGPLFVLLHGAGDQAGTWHRIAPELAKKYSLVMPDLAGHGQSAPNSGALGIGTMLNALEQILDSASCKLQHFILAGNSLGAWIAMLYARTHPERVSRLFLLNGGALRHEQAEITLLPKDREEARRAFDAVLDPATLRPPNFVLDDYVRVAKRGPIARIAATIAEIPAYTLDGKLSDFPVPVDVIWGASDRLVPLEYAQMMAEQLPSARMTVIEYCGHVPQLECPAKLLATLLPLLAGQPPQNKEPVAKPSTLRSS